MKIKNEMTERNTREPFLHTPIRTWNDPPRQVQHFTFVCTRQQKSCFAGKPELKKLSKSTCLSTNLRLFPKDEEGAGVWDGVAMMGAISSGPSILACRQEGKMKTPENFLACVGKKDLLHYPNPNNTSEELPSTNHCRHLEN